MLEDREGVQSCRQKVGSYAESEIVGGEKLVSAGSKVSPPFVSPIRGNFLASVPESEREEEDNQRVEIQGMDCFRG